MKSNDRPLPTHPTSRSVPHHLVAERAYAIWLARGQPIGCDYDHWVEAQRQLVARFEEAPESLAARLEHWGDPLSSSIERALNSLARTAQARSATSL